MSLERKLTGSGETVVNVTDGKSGGLGGYYVQVVGRYGQHTLDQCHTVATALGYACVNISEEMDRSREGSPLEAYLLRCYDDAAEELRLVNERIATLTSPKMTVSYSGGQTVIGAEGVSHTHFQNGVA